MPKRLAVKFSTLYQQNLKDEFTAKVGQHQADEAG